MKDSFWRNWALVAVVVGMLLFVSQAFGQAVGQVGYTSDNGVTVQWVYTGNGHWEVLRTVSSEPVKHEWWESRDVRGEVVFTFIFSLVAVCGTIILLRLIAAEERMRSCNCDDGDEDDDESDLTLDPEERMVDQQ